MAHSQVRSQAQPRAVVGFDLPLQQSRVDRSPKRPVEVSDLRTDQMTEMDAREYISEFVIYRFEKMKDDKRLEMDRASPRETWEVAVRTEVRDLSKEDAAEFIHQLDMSGKSVVEEKASLPPALQRQVERAQDFLTEQEQEPQVFQWVLAQLYSKKRRLDRRAAEYYVSKSYRDEIRLFSSRGARSSSRERRSKPKKERIALTAFFKRMPRPNISALDVLEQRRRTHLMLQQQAAMRAMATHQMQDNKLNEQLRRAQQQALQRQAETQQHARAIEAGIPQQLQQQQQQQHHHHHAVQQQSQGVPRAPGAQNQARQTHPQGLPRAQSPRVQQQNMPRGVDHGAQQPPVPPPAPRGKGQDMPTVPMPPTPQTTQSRQGQQKQPQPRQQQTPPPGQGQPRQQSRPRAYSGDSGSPRSSRESIDSDDYVSHCDSADTPISSVSADTRRAPRDRPRSRSKGRYHPHCEDCPDQYGFEPVRSLTRHDQHYILENRQLPRVIRDRDLPPAEPTVTMRELETIKREAYDAGVAARRAMARGIGERPVDDLVFRPSTSFPPRVLQRQPSVRLVHPQRLVEEELELERLRLDEDLYERRRIDEDLERRRLNEAFERRLREEEYERRRYDDAIHAEMEEDLRRRRVMESQLRRPLTEEDLFAMQNQMREERAADDREYMRTRERSPIEFENPFGPFDRGRRVSMGGIRGW